MLWNWYTVDSCFIARSWHVRSSGAFAGTCIGVILLVIALEFVRRTQREYDAYILRQWKLSSTTVQAHRSESGSSTDKQPLSARLAPLDNRRGAFRPSMLQQLIRSLLYMVQFGVGYFVMLLAM
jgi:solute carrier family 31 (copper transporter), member 1